MPLRARSSRRVAGRVRATATIHTRPPNRPIGSRKSAPSNPTASAASSQTAAIAIPAQPTTRGSTRPSSPGDEDAEQQQAAEHHERRAAGREGDAVQGADRGVGVGDVRLGRGERDDAGEPEHGRRDGAADLRDDPAGHVVTERAQAGRRDGGEDRERERSAEREERGGVRGAVVVLGRTRAAPSVDQIRILTGPSRPLGAGRWSVDGGCAHVLPLAPGTEITRADLGLCHRWWPQSSTVAGPALLRLGGVPRPRRPATR